MEEEISLVDLLDILKKHVGVIITTTVLGLVAAFLLTRFLITPMYASHAQLLVSHSQTGNTIQQSEINANIQLINTYEDIIRNPIILEEVQNNLGLNYSIDDLRDRVGVQTDQDSQVFSIRVEDEDPVLAADIANEAADVFSDNIDDIMNVDNVSIISQAVPNRNPASPNLMLNTLIGALLGLMVGLAYAILKEVLDTSVKDEDFMVNEIGWPSLGRVSQIDRHDAPKKMSQTQDEAQAINRRSRK